MPAFRSALAAFVLITALAITAPARADDHPPVLDEVLLPLTVEAWVEAEMPRIVVSVNAAGTGSNAGRVRAEILEALDRIAANAEWRFTSFNRSEDRAGMEQWQAMVETRLPETALDGLADKADASSRPGLQIRLVQTDFSPTLAELEATRAQLRAEIYAQVKAELDRLNTAFDDRNFRVGAIRFGDLASLPAPRMRQEMQMMSARAASADMAGSGGIAVANKLQLSATVELSAFAIAPDDD